MPSPVGHSLAGLALGAAWLIPPGGLRQALQGATDRWKLLLFILLMANAPDLDFVPGLVTGQLNAFHRGWTHSLLGGLILTLLGWLAWRLADREVGTRHGIFLLALVFSHLLLDWLCADPAPPHGLNLGWPFSAAYHIAPGTVFLSITKSKLSDVVLFSNLMAVLVEIAWLLPVLAAAIGWNMQRGKTAS